MATIEDFEEISAAVRMSQSVDQGVELLYAMVQRRRGAEAAVMPILRTLLWNDDLPIIREALADRFRSAVPADTTGLYLGIDGLNMPAGKAIEMGCSSAWYSGDKTINYIYKCGFYCSDLPLPSLAAYYTWYYRKAKRREGFDYLDVEYPVCWGLSAVVICRALTMIEPAVLCGTQLERCFAFGFHDGDMMKLGRATTSGFVNEATSDCW